MLTVYRSNRAEWLAKVLSEQLRLDPPLPFETVEVLVNTWPTSRWLSEQLSTVNGISALIRFPFPGTRLRELVKLVLGLEEQNKDPWKANRLVWHILEALPELLKANEAAPLKEWLNRHPSSQGVINKEEWQLASNIASAFDDYALYRTNEITQWMRYSGKTPPKMPDIKNQETWQPLLMHLLTKTIDDEPFGIQVKRAVEQLKEGKSPAKTLPTQLHIFGLSSLAPVQVELIQALSGVINIKMFLLTPCRDLWQRCASRREQLGKDWATPPDGQWLIQSPRLEAHLGRMGAEFQQLMEGSGESQLGEVQEGDLFAAPRNIAIESGKKPTLLEQLQQQLIFAQKEESIGRELGDTSLLFVACPGQRRQVELVRDQILQLLAAEPSLEPRDILIMTPQIELYAPLISSIFNDISATNVELPHRITDRSQEQIPGVTQFILQFLGLATNRINATAVSSLLANPAVQTQQGLNQEDAIKISDYLQLTGFRWGLDADDRGGDEIHSLSWCLDRWLLGLVMPNKPGFAPGGTAPYSKGISYNQLSKWWGFLSLLCNQLREIRRPHTPKQWIKQLKSFVEQLFGDGDSWRSELKTFLCILEDWRQVAENYQLEISASVVSEIISQSLKAEAGRFGHRSGQISISALEPMRAIPHRVIVLMGLDADIFPRYKDRPGFHLLGQGRRLGDPSSSDQDRYVLLEALMSTRNHLMITWNSRNERTGESLPPASPVQQWIRQLKNELEESQWPGLFKEPHPNPLDRSNFLSLDNLLPISCDRRNLGAKVLLNKKSDLQPLALALPLTWTTQEQKGESSISNELLKDWLIAPQRVWLEQLQLQPKEWINPLEDFEKLDLTELQRYHLLKERFEELIIQLSTCKDESQESTKEDIWVERFQGQGALPPSAAASIECELLENRWKSIKSILENLGSFRKQTIFFNDGYEDILWAGNFVVVVELGKLKSKAVMKGWLSHLLVCASDRNPAGTLVIARNSSKSKKSLFDIAIKWHPLSKKQAEEELTKIKNLALQGLQTCWPVPPESGWEFIKANHKDPLKGEMAFKRKWNGVFNLAGERDSTEMKLCFGINYEFDNFINNTSFLEACTSLYNPLIESLND